MATASHGSTQCTTEDDLDVGTNPPNPNHDVHRSLESLRVANSSTPNLNGHDTSNPWTETASYVAQTATKSAATSSTTS